MNKEELHNIVEKQQPNICQIVAIKNNEIVYNDTWNNYKNDDNEEKKIYRAIYN